MQAPEGVLAFRRGSGVSCIVNVSAEAMELPEGEVMLASGDLEDGLLPAGTTVWMT